MVIIVLYMICINIRGIVCVSIENNVYVLPLIFNNKAVLDIKDVLYFNNLRLNVIKCIDQIHAALPITELKSNPRSYDNLFSHECFVWIWWDVLVKWIIPIFYCFRNWNG